MSVSRLSKSGCSPLAQRIDDLTSVVYIGNAPINSLTSAPVWEIKRISFSGTFVITEWADGNDLNDNVWDNRLGLVYS